MIIDCREWEDTETCQRERRRVFVDGVEIHQVFYVDTDQGFVRTYDVLGDGKVHTTREVESTSLLAARIAVRASTEGNWGVNLNGVLTKTISGVVELRPFEEAREG